MRLRDIVPEQRERVERRNVGVVRIAGVARPSHRRNRGARRRLAFAEERLDGGEKGPSRGVPAAAARAVGVAPRRSSTGACGDDVLVAPQRLVVGHRLAPVRHRQRGSARRPRTNASLASSYSKLWSAATPARKADCAAEAGWAGEATWEGGRASACARRRSVVWPEPPARGDCRATSQRRPPDASTRRGQAAPALTRWQGAPPPVRAWVARRLAVAGAIPAPRHDLHARARGLHLDRSVPVLWDSDLEE